MSIILTEEEARLMFRETDDIIVDNPIDFLTEEDINNLKSFHDKKIFQLNFNGFCFQNNKAHTFCIELGYSDYLSKNDSNDRYINDCYIVTANHKGFRSVRMLQIPYDNFKWI